jgi:hypothetical protein
LPFQSRVPANTFDPDTIRILAAAFEDAWRALETDGIDIGPGTDQMRDSLAKAIVEAASHGERDPHRLRDAALAHLAHSPRREGSPPK